MDLFGFEIRRAKADDFPQLCTLFDELDKLHRHVRPDLFCKPDGPPRALDDVMALIDGPDSTLLVADDRAFGQLIGLASIVIRDVPALRIRPARRMVEIDNLSVSRFARRHGAGRALVRAASIWAAERGFDTLELGVLEFNAPALDFYTALGFRTFGRRLTLQLGE